MIAVPKSVFTTPTAKNVMNVLSNTFRVIVSILSYSVAYSLEKSATNATCSTAAARCRSQPSFYRATFSEARDVALYRLQSFHTVQIPKIPRSPRQASALNKCLMQPFNLLLVEKHLMVYIREFIQDQIWQ